MGVTVFQTFCCFSNVFRPQFKWHVIISKKNGPNDLRHEFWKKLWLSKFLENLKIKLKLPNCSFTTSQIGREY